MPRGIPQWMEQAEEAFLREQEERRQREALSAEPPKVGLDPSRPWHPVLNPNLEEQEQQHKRWIESCADQKAKQRTASQEQHWKEAIRLITEGRCPNYMTLGQHFKRPWYERRQGKGETYTAKWAYHLVQKMIQRGVFTYDTIKVLIPDQTSPFTPLKPK